MCYYIAHCINRHVRTSIIKQHLLHNIYTYTGAHLLTIEKHCDLFITTPMHFGHIRIVKRTSTKIYACPIFQLYDISAKTSTTTSAISSRGFSGCFLIIFLNFVTLKTSAITFFIICYPCSVWKIAINHLNNANPMDGNTLNKSLSSLMVKG